MPPKQHSLSLLFHPKKNTKSDGNKTPPRKPTAPRPKLSPEKSDDEELKLPDGPYQEFKLMSSALNGWKYDVMKFDSRKVIDISKWTAPIKLNRKELRKDTEPNAPPAAVAPMLGPDGKPVIGADGKIVMVDAEGRPIQQTDGSNGKDGKGKATVTNGKKRFQKKTKQVFYVPDEVRQLRKEERYPWVMEDSSPAHDEMWVGQLEDVSRSDTHAFFMPAANDVFKFVPAHRWYKFQKKLKHDLPTSTAEVESLYNLSQKRDPQTWLASRNGRGPSAATAAMFKAEAEGRPVSSASLVYSSGSSLGPGGRRLKTVDSGMSGLFDDDDDPESRRRREREYGGEGDLDEQVYEEEFADDEEKVEADENDEEAKELEERLKREYKSANRQRDTGTVESDEEEIPSMSKQAKAMQRLIRNREGNEAYESDDEKNPYASSEEEEEEEEVSIPPHDAAAQPPASQSSTQTDNRADSQTPKPGAVVRPGSSAGSRATSPVPLAPSPNHGGHSVVAKRATSDKTPKANVSRANSPIGSRATSPVANSRATSPAGLGLGISMDGQKVSNKRKAEDMPNGAPSPTATNNNGSAAPKPKKRKAQNVVPITVSAAELKNLLVEWLKNTINATTRDCIQHFTPYLTDQEKKTEFSTLVKEVAQLKNGVLVLRGKVG
ncbi:hypothetical protein AMATHDRAFT_56087 [Amanita thiersii Skay4041]|uniref:Uncharacterized protein n=1 Tax=Amanita thiersii Skay4041 TaxID=703135 RepID=A0A2A9NXR1_9AGAR|nr:hypothetical protein AMATHDRAFT_56087 [Amanita thiersii Skay4041]